jgi:hypothetical protein
MEAGLGTKGGMTGLLLADQGVGPLLRRDYWAVIDRCRLSPSALMRHVALHFADFAPEKLVVFDRSLHPGAPLALGDELHVRIRGAGSFGVRMVHQDAQSFTLATLPGHPEAGRITFGAYRNRRGDVIFHIRSVARSGSRLHYLGFRMAGEPMQTNTWTEFVNRAALTFGEGVIGPVHAETLKLRWRPGQEDCPECPTYLARGD